MKTSRANAGGIFGPSLFIGAMRGGAVGSVAHHFLPDYTAGPGSLRTRWDGTAFAGIVRTPMTSVIMIFEIWRRGLRRAATHDLLGTHRNDSATPEGRPNFLEKRHVGREIEMMQKVRHQRHVVAELTKAPHTGDTLNVIAPCIRLAACDCVRRRRRRIRGEPGLRLLSRSRLSQFHANADVAEQRTRGHSRAQRAIRPSGVSRCEWRVSLHRGS